MNITLILTNAFSLIFGASLTLGVQYILNKQKAKLDFKQKQLSELYQPLHELITKNAMILTIDQNEKEESYNLVYSIIELITKKIMLCIKKSSIKYWLFKALFKN